MIYLRLKEERERLGLTQPAFAELGGAAKRTVIDWEKGVSSPTAVQLAAMATAGADVLYVLTGARGQGGAEIDLLPADERVLVDAYRRCAADAKRNLIQTAVLLSAGMATATAPAAAQTTKNSVRIGGSVGAGSTVVSGHQQGMNRGKKPATKPT